ncbi:MAG: caspase family protein [Planctomycetota bacterium]
MRGLCGRWLVLVALSACAAAPEPSGTHEAPAEPQSEYWFRPEHQYALLIANREYLRPSETTSPPGVDNDWYLVDNAHRDVEALRLLLVTRYDFEPDQVEVVRDASEREVIDALNSLAEHPDEASVLVYYAGHSHRTDLGEFYWIPVDGGHPDGGAEDRWVSASTIHSKIDLSPARHKLLISDSCYSGALVRKRKTRGAGPVMDSYREPSYQVFASGGEDEEVYEGDGKLSMFAACLVRRLEHNGTRFLLASELGAYLREYVPKESDYPQLPEWCWQSGSGEFVFRDSSPEPDDGSGGTGPGGSTGGARLVGEGPYLRRETTPEDIVGKLAGLVSASGIQEFARDHYVGRRNEEAWELEVRSNPLQRDGEWRFEAASGSSPIEVRSTGVQAGGLRPGDRVLVRGRVAEIDPYSLMITLDGATIQALRND